MIKVGKRRSLRILFFLMIWLIGLMTTGAELARAQARDGAVHILHIEGVINPPVANYLERGLREAQEENSQLVIIQMDTPGGLDTSMRRITQAIFASPVPVAVYVSPPGARAASAGLFILISSHVAAMAPGTNTGAAHPVGLGGEAEEAAVAKAVNDAAATIRTLARERGRNAEWAEQAVRESVSITEREALELGVIEVIARDIDDLLQQVDGTSVVTSAGEVILEVAGADRNEVPMTFAERFLHVISDPNIAFILLSVGSIGLLAELYNPGALFPGITGIISLILAFFSLGNLPTNWAGVALVGLATILFVAELATEGTGILGVGAIIAFFLGGLILFRPFRPVSPALPDLSVNPWVMGGSTAVLGLLVIVVFTQLARTRRVPHATGAEHFIGQTAVVYEDLNPRGRVWFEGQTWFARLQTGQVVTAGQPVRIVGLEGLTLLVEPAAESEPGEQER